MAFPSNAVERVMRQVMEGHVPVDEFFRALADATLIVPTTGLVGEDQDRAEMEVIQHEGRPYVPAFTSADQHAHWRGGAGRYVLLTGRQLGEAWPGDVGLAINPGGDAGLPMPPDRVRALAGPMRTVPAGTTMRIGHPATEPAALLDALATALPQVEAVVSARRALVAAGDDPPSLVVALELEPADGVVAAAAEHAAVSVAGETIRTAAPDLPVDVLCFPEGGATGLAEEIVRLAEPFYRRVTGAAR